VVIYSEGMILFLGKEINWKFLFFRYVCVVGRAVWKRTPECVGIFFLLSIFGTKSKIICCLNCFFPFLSVNNKFQIWLTNKAVMSARAWDILSIFGQENCVPKFRF
jgi:hypothetical protein